MGRITRLDGLHLKYAFLAGTRCLGSRKDHINHINVFPVPDGDTGTNMFSTLSYISTQADFSRSFSLTFDSIAEKALIGARGNSGLILAQYLYGLSKVFKGQERVDAMSFGEGIISAFPFALNALSDPREGTMVTVLREWSGSVHEMSRDCPDFRELFEASLLKAMESLGRTTEMLKPLRDAHVVDAGAMGFVQFIRGIIEMKPDDFLISDMKTSTPEINGMQDDHMYPGRDGTRYCTEMVLEGKETLPLAEIRHALSQMGDSIVIGGGEKFLRIHIHTNDPSAVASTLKEWGNIPHQKVDDMFRQLIKPSIGKSHNRIALLTDSACDLPQTLLDRYNIHVIPMKLTLGSDEYLDKLTIKPSMIYHLMRSDSAVPVSSMANPGEFRNLYSMLLGNYDSVIAIHLSDKLSGTYQASCSAVSALGAEERVTVINSRHLCVSLGLIVLQAAEAIERGSGHDQVVEMIEQLLGRAFIYVSLDNMKYMVRGGRIGPIAGNLARILNLKPVISVDREGKGIHLGQACGKRANISRITRLFLDHWREGFLSRYAVVHAGALPEAEQLARDLEERTGKKAEYVMEISPVIGVNSGPGSIAVGGILGKQRR